MLFSIIVPVYNVRDFLSRCVVSVENQETRYTYEIILVDDGSTDGSSELCDLLESYYNNIVVIHKDNGGLSDARNRGLLEAKGEYVIFLDSDDYLANGALEKVGAKIETNSYDILYANVIVEVNGREIKLLRKRGLNEQTTYDGCSAMISELKTGKFQAISTMGIYRSSYLIDNGLMFKKGILHEDEEWSPRVMSSARTIKYIDVPFYMYIIREGSITRAKDKTKNSSDLIDTCVELDALFKVHTNVLLRKLYRGYLARLYMTAVADCIVHGNFSKIREKVTRRFIWGKWVSIKDFIKAIAFCISPRFYSILLEKARTKAGMINSQVS